MKTAGDYITRMRFRVPARVPSDFSWYHALNAAGSDFFNRHPWSFAGETQGVVYARAGQDVLELPHDFVALRSAVADNLNTDSVESVSLSRIQELQAGIGLTQTGGPWSICWDASWTQRTPSTAPAVTAPIYPTPTTDRSPSVRIAYERGWREIPEGMAAAIPNIPPFAESVFMTLCAAVAFERAFEKPSADRAIFERELPFLIRTDERRTTHVKTKGGLACPQDDDWRLPETAEFT